MSLAAGTESSESRSLVSANVWARALAEEEMDRAAAIWDWLAAHEKGKFMDAESIAHAQEFVSQYTAAAKSTRPHELAEAWTAWKNASS
jgi:hypothetical protein